MKLSAPAKVNLHLRILQRREDGFHDIETLMVPLSLADEIWVETSAGSLIELACDLPDVPLGDENLATRAARLFARETGREFSAKISITKRIPMGAGLAGGSSNGAAVLVALDEIFQTNLGPERLENLAAQLGSDVAFFIRQTPAWCRGRGEQITPFVLPEILHFLLLRPPFGVETPWAYQRWAGSHSIAEELEAPQSLGWVSIVNSLERPVFEKFLLLPAIKQWLLAQPETRVAAMSGSGSTMFAVLHRESDGPALEERAQATFGDTLWTALCRSTQNE
jgi:4-diphosphocytidyl-2-C-methyl-D-erythritol kinase